MLCLGLVDAGRDHTSQIHGTLFYYFFFVPYIMGIHSPLVIDNHIITHNQLTQHAELEGSTKIRSRGLSNISPEKQNFLVCVFTRHVAVRRVT